MTITSAFVLFAVIWFLTFLIVIPFKIKTQGDLGTVATGTQAGAPEVHNLKKKAIITTGVTICLLYTSPSPRDYAASRMPSSA